MSSLDIQYTQKGVLFSCKVSNSCFVYYDRKNLDLEPLYAAIDTPYEFLKDPSYWLEAPKMESFLAAAEKIYDQKYPDKKLSFVEDLAHSSSELRSWGVLDGVLRMLQKPQDIFSKPERFISYFISPAPPIANILREENAISFMLPISQEEYPLSLGYIKSVMEILPTFAGKNSFQVSWEGNTVFISWEGQDALFNEDPGHIMKPELMASLSETLEKSQRELEEKNKELKLKNMELEKAKQALEKNLLETKNPEQTTKAKNLNEAYQEILAPLSYMNTNVHRLQDYMARAHQLVTLLVGQGRADKQVKEAMKRVDWDYVLKEYPNLINDLHESLDKMRDHLNTASDEALKEKKELKPESDSHFKLQIQ